MAALPHLGSFSGRQWVRESLGFFSRPFQILRAYRRENLRPDLIAGLTIAAVLLPHSIAYALLAELPPQFGLYMAIIGAIVGALWGSSAHLQTGPTNALSLLVLSSLLPLVASGTPQFLAAAAALPPGFCRIWGTPMFSTWRGECSPGRRRGFRYNTSHAAKNFPSADQLTQEVMRAILELLKNHWSRELREYQWRITNTYRMPTPSP